MVYMWVIYIYIYGLYIVCISRWFGSFIHSFIGFILLKLQIIFTNKIFICVCPERNAYTHAYTGQAIITMRSLPTKKLWLPIPLRWGERSNLFLSTIHNLLPSGPRISFFFHLESDRDNRILFQKNCLYELFIYEYMYFVNATIV